MGVLDTANGRASLHEAFKHLLVSGNVLLYVSEAGIRVIHLDRFVLCRDPMGHVTEIVREEVYSQALLRGFWTTKKTASTATPAARRRSRFTPASSSYNGVPLVSGGQGKEVPGTHGMCKEDVTPWISLRFDRVESEEYGRSYVEQYYGDLLALENEPGNPESSAAAAKAIFLVNPNGMTRPRTLANAANGAIVQGSASDITVVQTQKGADMQGLQTPPLSASSSGCSTPSCCTPLSSGRVRTCDCGGDPLHEPGAERWHGWPVLHPDPGAAAAIGAVHRCTSCSAAQAASFPKGQGGKALVNPKPVTGLEAIGRGDDKNKLIEFITTARKFLAQIMAEYINVDEALRPGRKWQCRYNKPC